MVEWFRAHPEAVAALTPRVAHFLETGEVATEILSEEGE